MSEKEYKATEEIELREGYIRDFLTNKWIRLTPEEQVRQIMLMRLVQEYEYPKEWTKTEFEIQKGSKRIGPADIVVFRDGKNKDQEHIWIIVETKRKERSDGIEQLKTYLSPCKGAKFGVWFNGSNICFCYCFLNGICRTTKWTDSI